MDFLGQYQHLSDEIQLVLSQENNLLKQGQIPTKSLLECKRQLLRQLEPLTEQMEHVETLCLEDKKRAQKLQQRLMKLLILDRENEKMLLEVQMRQRASAMPENVSHHRLRSLYHEDAY